MQDNKLRAKAAAFAKRWEGKGYEKGHCQPFWIELLGEVLAVERPTDIISFENQVKLNSTSFIDAYISTTKVLIEQKSIDKDLKKAIPQSDGSLLTPFQQAKRYAAELPYSKRPRWVVVSNFKEFHIYDMEQPQGEPYVLLLANLEKEYDRLRFLVDDGSEHLKREMEISIQAGALVGKLYEAFLKQYLNPDSAETLRALNILCVRLVFCLYAEDSGLFGENHSAFYDYLNAFDDKHKRKALIELFEVLNTPVEERDPYMEPVLKAFPYVSGGLFADDKIEIPNFNADISDLLLEKGSEDIDWSNISPTIFGAVFESTLNPETRRSGGMHYTSIENIHKVIDPLFMDDLTEEFQKIKAEPVEKTRNKKLSAFQDKLASLKFLDPACGSGNFLTETYISLRRLENQVISTILGGQAVLGEFNDPIKVSINQFYGIEINDFAVTVGQTALWIAEAQMMAETERIVQKDIDFLPLKSYANIHEENALRVDWADICDPKELNYIMGNPPFVGYSLQSDSQKEDILSIYVDEKGKPYKTAGKIDYVAAWYWKASSLMSTAYKEGRIIRSALVSTNSITQGEQVAAIWKPLYDRFNIHIDFAWRTFRWDSESSLKAHVHCVIVGFSVANNHKKRILYYSNESYKECNNINSYLIAANNIFVESNKSSICDVPPMTTGNRPADGGHLIIDFTEYDSFIKKEPKALPYIKNLIGSEEFINNKKRYCLWLTNITPAELRNMPSVLERVAACKLDREASPDPGRRKLAERPHLFRETNNPNSFIVVPAVSSERRKYIPMGFLNNNYIPTNLVTIIPDATLYHFGILTSNVHMAWMRAVCGRLEMRYRYSKDIVYNNFPWPTPTDAQKAKIEQTAQTILNARALYPDSSLADLYDEVTMPPELRKAHQQNDRAVMEAYGFPIKDFTESDCVAKLLEMYQKLTEK